jgi:hypothetical protein
MHGDPSASLTSTGIADWERAKRAVLQPRRHGNRTYSDLSTQLAKQLWKLTFWQGSDGALVLPCLTQSVAGPEAGLDMASIMETQQTKKEDAFFAEQRKAALSLVMDAFTEGRLDGLEADCMAQAALFAALKELVDIYGEEAVADFASRLPDRVRSGEYSLNQRRN